jgi:hypothetical protein
MALDLSFCDRSFELQLSQLLCSAPTFQHTLTHTITLHRHHKQIELAGADAVL